MTCFHLHEGPSGVELIEEVVWQEPGAWVGRIRREYLMGT